MLTLRRNLKKTRKTQHGSKLKSGETELAVTGSAFKILQLMGKAQELLYCTRVFARVKPEGKVRLLWCLCGEFEFLLRLFFIFLIRRIPAFRVSFHVLTCAAITQTTNRSA